MLFALFYFFISSGVEFDQDNLVGESKDIDTGHCSSRVMFNDNEFDAVGLIFHTDSKVDYEVLSFDFCDCCKFLLMRASV